MNIPLNVLFAISIISILFVGIFSQTVSALSDNTGITLEQCHNGNPIPVDCDDPEGHENFWGQGNANTQNSLIFEGDSQNYRVIITNLPAGNYSLVIEQDLTKSGTLAQDFWTGPGNILTKNFPTVNGIGIHPCVDSNGNQNGYCDPIEIPYEVAIPIMGEIISLPESSGGGGNVILGNLINEIQTKYIDQIPPHQISKSMLMHGNVTNASLEITKFSGDVNSDSSIQGTINFTTNSFGNVVLYYGGHISETEDYELIGRQSAINIPGSPYHNRLISFDGINGSPGKQDMQLMATDTQPILSLTVVKNVVNGTTLPDDFNLTVNGTSVLSGASNFFAADVTLTLGETSLPNYELTGITGIGCPENLDEPFLLTKSTMCTITNTFTTPSKLTLIKDVINDDGGIAGPDDFGISVDGNVVTSGQTIEYPIGVPLEINEIGLAGYAFISIAGDAECPEELGQSITLAEGDDVTCTITNDDVPPPPPPTLPAFLTLIKDVINDDGGIAGPDDFGISVNGTIVPSGDKIEYPVNTGLTVDESGLAGYAFISIAGDAECPEELGQSITLAEGDDVTCTITNDDVPPPPPPTLPAFLTLIKDVINDDGGIAGPDDFGISVNGTIVATSGDKQ